VNRVILVLFFLFLIFSKTALSTQNHDGKFEYEHLENGRIIAKTGSSTVSEYKLKQFGEITLDVKNFYFHDIYRSMASNTEVDNKTTKFHDKKNQFRVSVGLANIFLMNLGSDASVMYHHKDSKTVQFNEDESIKLSAFGVGLILENFVLAFYPKAQIRWEYDLRYLGKDVFNENIKYNLAIIQVIRQSNAVPGFYLDFNYVASKLKNSLDREGWYNGSKLYTEVGWLSRKGVILWYGRGNSDEISESILNTTSASLEKEEKIARTTVGIAYPISFASNLVVRRVNYFKTVNITHDNYIAQKRLGEDTVSIGLNLKEKKLLVEFKLGTTYYTRKLEETTLITPADGYAVADILVGFGFRYSFGIRR
jgi:hypothetical protein